MRFHGVLHQQIVTKKTGQTHRFQPQARMIHGCVI
jgi:hypothetical protein